MSNNDLTKKALVNTYYDSNVNKFYLVNDDGTKGSEIKMGTLVPSFKAADKLQSFTGTGVNTVSHDGFLIVYGNAGGSLYINEEHTALIGANPYPYYVRTGDTVRCDTAPVTCKVVRAVMVTE